MAWACKVLIVLCIYFLSLGRPMQQVKFQNLKFQLCLVEFITWWYGSFHRILLSFASFSMCNLAPCTLQTIIYLSTGACFFSVYGYAYGYAFSREQWMNTFVGAGPDYLMYLYGCVCTSHHIFCSRPQVAHALWELLYWMHTSWCTCILARAFIGHPLQGSLEAVRTGPIFLNSITLSFLCLHHSFLHFVDIVHH